MSKILSLFVILSLIPISGFANNLSDKCTAWKDEETNKPLIIGKINLNVNNIFDLSLENESRLFHHGANKFHLKTKKFIIERELLFKTGDEFSTQILQETERHLRSLHFIKDAQINPSEICGNKVTISIETKDNWTLTPGISFGTSGGKSKYSLELQEKNLLGLGKSLEFKYKNGIERNQKSISYLDQNFFGTEKHVDLTYENNSDGRLYYANVYKPFRSLNSINSWDLLYFDSEKIHPLYLSGEVNNEIGQNQKLYSVSVGRLVNRNSNDLHRLYFGYTSDESSFFNSELYPDSSLPDQRVYHYPWIQYQYFQDQFVEMENFNSMGKVEDISLGANFSTKIGVESSMIHYNADFTKSFYNNDKNLFQLNTYANGIFTNKQVLNAHSGFNLKWYRFQNPNKSFFISSSYDHGKNLYPELPNYLGGDTGLRGYPFRYLSGENSFIFSAEQRFFYNWYPLKTFQFGSAIFLDSGTVWNNGEQKKYFTNIGIGFRLVPTRTSSGRVLHLDLAFPLDDRDLIDGFQLILRTKKSF
jgi:outer membrane protein assembly factor BamA